MTVDGEFLSNDLKRDSNLQIYGLSSIIRKAQTSLNVNTHKLPSHSLATLVSRSEPLILQIKRLPQEMEGIGVTSSVDPDRPHGRIRKKVTKGQKLQFHCSKCIQNLSLGQ